MFKRKNAVAAVIVLFICVAVYLNWSFTREATEQVTDVMGQTGDELVDDAEPDAQAQSPEKAAEEKSGEDGEGKKTSSEYFTGARIERQKARDNALSILKDASEQEGLPKESRDKAAESMETLARGAVNEAHIETLIKAKGFSECVTLLNNDNASVIVQVPEGGLSQADSAKIMDIVVAETGISANNVKIVEIN